MINLTIPKSLFLKTFTEEEVAAIRLQTVLQKPDVDRHMAALRLRRWQEWKHSANLDPGDVRNAAPRFVCHDPYTEEERMLFKTHGVEFCPGGCYDQCRYLKTSPTNIDSF